MKLCFVAAEPQKREFFEREFEVETSTFCEDLSLVDKDVQILCVFIGSVVDAEFLDVHPELRLVATRSTTFDHIDLEACKRRGVAVCGVPSYGDHTVAEHTMALLLAITRRLQEVILANLSHKFSYQALLGMELDGKTLGVIGTGRIGLRMLHLSKAFGMKLLATDIRPDPAAAERLGFTYVPLDDLLAQSDVISLHIPLTPDTFHLFNTDTFEKCRHGVILINTARGNLIDTAALIEALEAGIVGGAGLDVLEDERVMREPVAQIITSDIIDRLHEDMDPSKAAPGSQARTKRVGGLIRSGDLFEHPNVLVTPHIAFNTHEAMERIDVSTADNIKAFIAGRRKAAVLPTA